MEISLESMEVSGTFFLSIDLQKEAGDERCKVCMVVQYRTENAHNRTSQWRRVTKMPLLASSIALRSNGTVLVTEVFPS